MNDTPRQERDSIEWLGAWIVRLHSGNTVTATTAAETYEDGGDITIGGKAYEVKVISTPDWHFDPRFDRGDASKVTGGFTTYINDYPAYYSKRLQKTVTCKMDKFRAGKLDGIFIIAPTRRQIAFFTTADLLNEADSNGRYAKLHVNVKTKGKGNLQSMWCGKALVNCLHATHLYNTEDGDMQWETLRWMCAR